ncbi:deuterolysin M35 metalloprotease [Auriculariales sp. MPI-PUGE-AT-0066]|nr:deuterolysin M35 metalloprotease [Auriculariales sp. MPI-PUGE-AT-0066]
MIATSLVALALSSVVAAGPILSLSLAGPANHFGAGSIVVSATLTNTGDETATLLNDPNTVLSTSETNTFAISTVDGKTPTFLGKFVKWTPSTAEKTVLAPGESVTISHKIGNAYDFTHTGAGLYSIETSSKLTLVTENGFEEIHADTTALETKLTGALIKPELKTAVENARSRAISRRSLDKRISYDSCSSSRQSQIATAASSALTYATNAAAYLTNHTTTSTRYTTWFGTFTSSRRSTVLSHYNNLKSHSWSSNTYSCDCTESAYAYTYSYATGEMWLCSAFWSAPTTGTDSKAGTIVHESTHWDAIAGTDDYAYGQTAAKSLAKSSPSTAIFNADSHEYFAENTPSLS